MSGAPRGRRRLWLAGALAAAALAIAPLASRWTPREHPGDGTVAVFGQLPATGTHSATLSEEGAVVTAEGADPFVLLVAPPTSIRTARLELTPLRESTRDYYLYYTPASTPAAGFSEDHVVQGRVLRSQNGWRVEWQLPEPAAAYRLDVPEGAQFRVRSFEASREAGSLRTGAGTASRPVYAMVAVALLLGLAVQIAWRPFNADLRMMKSTYVAALLMPAAVLCFVLPPFQGPDEDAHWQIALACAGRPIAAEPSAYQLPFILDPEPIRFKQDSKFDAQRLTIAAADRPMTTVELRDRREWLRANYPYARPYAYPVVLLLSPFFPQITSVQQALLLFYLCRVVAAVALIAVLFAASRRHDLPFTALTLFSLPLLLQQSAVISVDVFLNLGALACMLLYLSVRERPRKLGLLALWALTLSIVGVKFVYAPLLALPVLALPQGPARRRLMIGAAVAAAALAYPAALLVLREVRAMGATMGRADETALQLASLATTGGWTDLLGLYLRYLETLLHARAWSEPLGWLDAPLSQPHLSLIRASAAAAVALDAWRYAPDAIALLRTRARAACGIILFALAALFFVTFADVLLFFLMTTSPGAPAVSGVQARHFFPVAIVVVLLPLLLLPRGSADESVPLRTCAWVILPGLLAARTVFLAQDLLVRYW